MLPKTHLPVLHERAVSKTQLESWRSCERKWGWSYLEGLKGRNKFADLGVRVHAQLERWLREGVLPDPLSQEGKIAESGLQHLPPPKSEGLVVESEVFTITKTAIYHGFVDWLEPEPVVGDHKTTVDFKWANTAESLADDIQCNIYSRAAMQLYETDRVLARWVYYRTRGAAKSFPVERLMHREEVERVFERTIDPLASEVLDAWAERPAVLDLRPNTKACSDFGGCSYREQCNLDAKGRFLAMVAHDGLAARMKAAAAARAAQQASATPAKTAPEPDARDVQVNPPEAAKTGTLAEKMAALRAKAAPAETPAPAAVETVPRSTGTGTLVSGSLVDRMKAKASAPEAPSSPPAADPAPSPPRTVKKAKEAQTEATTTTGGYVLLVNCLPLKSSAYLEAADYIAKVKAALEDEMGLVDYRLAEFNKGPALLSHGVRQLLGENPPPAGALVYLDKRTDEGRHAYEAFRELAGLVVHAL